MERYFQARTSYLAWWRWDVLPGSAGTKGWMQISAGFCESQVAAVDAQDVISHICFKKLGYPAWGSSKTLVTEEDHCDQCLGTHTVEQGNQSLCHDLFVCAHWWMKWKRWILHLLDLPSPCFHACVCTQINQSSVPFDYPVHHFCWDFPPFQVCASCHLPWGEETSRSMGFRLGVVFLLC